VTDRHPRADVTPLAEPIASPLVGPRVVLRQLEADDVATLHDLVLDNLDHLVIMAFTAHEPMGLDERGRLVDGWVVDRLQGLGAHLGIWHHEALIGMAGLHRRAPDPGTIEIGYWLGQEAEGSGYATEATLLLCDEAFRHPEISVVEIGADVSNDRSRATAERAGFRWVGTQPTRPELRSLAGTGIEARYARRRAEHHVRWRDGRS